MNALPLSLKSRSKSCRYSATLMKTVERKCQKVSYMVFLNLPLMPYSEMQQALQWWFKQQSKHLSEQSNQIHEGPLQEIFAMRLNIQSALSSSTVKLVAQSQDWLVKAEQMHHALAHLSDSLTPPYLEESLPLAIQSHLKRWQTTQPHCKLQLYLPPEWHNETPERSRIILTTLATLLSIAASASLPLTAVEVSLSNRQSKGELNVKVTYLNNLILKTITHAKELKYLCYCFRCLTPGWCSYQYQRSEAAWQFQWKSK